PRRRTAAAPSFAAVPIRPRGRAAVRHPVAVFSQTAPHRCGIGDVSDRLWRAALCRRILSRTRRLPRPVGVQPVHGPVALPADDPGRHRHARLGRAKGVVYLQGGLAMDDDDDDEALHASLRQRISELQTEHRDLDDAIARLSENPLPDQLRMQRLKKRKLLLKDQLTYLERQLDPDVLA